MSQALARVRQADPLGDAPRRRARTVVRHAQQQTSLSCVALTSRRPARWSRAIPCRIAFSTRGCRSRFGTRASRTSVPDPEARGEAVLEARLLDREVALQELQLLAQRDVRPPRVLQRDPQEVRELQDHALGRVRLRLQERRDRVQRVEQEVRLELHLQRAELGLRELGLEPGRGELAVPVLRVRVGAPREAHEGPVREDVRVEVQPEELRERRPERVRAAHRRVGQLVRKRPCEEELERREERRRGEVNDERLSPARALDREATRETEDRGRHERPEVVEGQVDEEGAPEGHLAPGRDRVEEIELAREEEPGHGPRRDVHRGSLPEGTHDGCTGRDTARRGRGLPPGGLQARVVAAGPHPQTIWGRLARSRTQVPLRREALTAPDGDTLLVDHLDRPGLRRPGGLAAPPPPPRPRGQLELGLRAGAPRPRGTRRFSRLCPQLPVLRAGRERPRALHSERAPAPLPLRRDVRLRLRGAHARREGRAAPPGGGRLARRKRAPEMARRAPGRRDGLGGRDAVRPLRSRGRRPSHGVFSVRTSTCAGS